MGTAPPPFFSVFFFGVFLTERVLIDFTMHPGWSSTHKESTKNPIDGKTYTTISYTISQIDYLQTVPYPRRHFWVDFPNFTFWWDMFPDGYHCRSLAVPVALNALRACGSPLGLARAPESPFARADRAPGWRARPGLVDSMTVGFSTKSSWRMSKMLVS